MSPGPVGGYFIDTSALLKAYVQEKGTDTMDRIFGEDAPRKISSMGLVEAASVLRRLHSVENALSRDQFFSLCARLFSDVTSGLLEVVSIDPQDVQVAISLQMTR